MNLIPKENNPCYGCAERKAMCGIGCKRYKQFRDGLKEQREKSVAENRAEYDWWMYNKEKSERLKSHKEKGRK